MSYTALTKIISNKYHRAIIARNEDPADFQHNLNFLNQTAELLKEFVILFRTYFIDPVQEYLTEERIQELFGQLGTEIANKFKSEEFDRLIKLGLKKELKIKNLDANFRFGDIEDVNTFVKEMSITFSDGVVLQVKNDQFSEKAFNDKMDKLRLLDFKTKSKQLLLFKNRNTLFSDCVPMEILLDIAAKAAEVPSEKIVKFSKNK